MQRVVMHLIDISQSLIDVLNIIHFHDMRFRD